MAIGKKKEGGELKIERGEWRILCRLAKREGGKKSQDDEVGITKI